MRRDLRDVLHDQEPDLFACHPSPHCRMPVVARRSTTMHRSLRSSSGLQVVRPERRLDLELRLIGEGNDQRGR